jgi:ABC-type Fe3+-hydroxamate transport system substrate-binding protein
MIELKDQTGNLVRLGKFPGRIISLVPSITELLFDLGLDKEVVGITKFCVHPDEWFRAKTRIGGTKNVDVEKIKGLNPGLIIANKEENVKEQVEALAAFCPVYTSEIKTLEDALLMISDVGRLTGREETAIKISEKITREFSKLVKTDKPLKCCYLIWQDPYMAAGGDTFISDMLQRCGFENVFASRTRYPEVGINEIAGSGCEFVLLSSEPFPFREKHLERLASELSLAGSHARLKLVDGEMFSWYGSRLQHSPACFYKLQMFAIS